MNLWHFNLDFFWKSGELLALKYIFFACQAHWNPPFLCAGMQVLEWNGVLLMGKTYEEVQGLVGQPCNEAEVCVRL